MGILNALLSYRNLLQSCIISGCEGGLALWMGCHTDMTIIG